MYLTATKGEGWWGFGIQDHVRRWRIHTLHVVGSEDEKRRREEEEVDLVGSCRLWLMRGRK
jgi:hypothetical protein